MNDINVLDSVPIISCSDLRERLKTDLGRLKDLRKSIAKSRTAKIPELVNEEKKRCC